MNQPTREEFNELKEEVRKLKEQQTEPIRITDTILLQTLVTMAGTNATDMAVLKGEMSVLKQTADEQGRQLETLIHQSIGTKTAMEKRFDSIAEIQRLILARLPEKGE